MSNLGHMSGDKDEIAEVLIRCATAIDQKNWALFKTCFTQEFLGQAVVTNTGQTGPSFITVARGEYNDGTGPSYHRLSNIVIDVGGDRATVRSYVHILHMLTPGDESSWQESMGHYDDVFVRTAEGWRISSRTGQTPWTLIGGEQAIADASQVAARLSTAAPKSEPLAMLTPDDEEAK